MAYAKRLGHGDLHMIDVTGVPQWLEQRIAEAQSQQVLHRLLAKVVIDTEGLRFLEPAADRVVDLVRAGQVAADRLFHDDPRRALVEFVLAKPRADVDEQLRR